MKRRSIGILTTILAIFLNLSCNSQQRLIDSGSEIEEFDSMGYTHLGLISYRFDVENNERWYSGSPHKYRILNTDSIMIFEYYTSQMAIPCKTTTTFLFEKKNPQTLLFTKNGKVLKDGAKCYFVDNPLTIPFELVETREFIVNEIGWDIFKYEALKDGYCHTIYWSDSIGLIKIYSPVRGEESRIILNCEVTYNSFDKNYIAKSIRSQFYGLDEFHTNCGGEVRYINGHLIDFEDK